MRHLLEAGLLFRVVEFPAERAFVEENVEVGHFLVAEAFDDDVQVFGVEKGWKRIDSLKDNSRKLQLKGAYRRGRKPTPKVLFRFGFSA